jgi:hypothetical protein
MPQQETPRIEKLSADEEIERKSRKVAKDIFKMLEDAAGYIKNERADRESVVAQLERDIEQLQRNELVITGETFKKVREEASRILSHPGGKDQIVPELFDLLSRMEKKFN